MNIIKRKEGELENFNGALRKENKEETKQRKVKVRKNKETEMRETKQISKQEETPKCNESRQIGGIEKFRKNQKKHFERQKKKSN